jgi:hypothetical protein
MAPVYSKSFFYDTVAPGVPVSFMTGAPSETWILRDILCSVGLGVINWVVEITDSAGNAIFVTPAIAVNPFVSQPLRLVLMPATSYTVSVSGTNVFVSLSGYVLSA